MVVFVALLLDNMLLTVVGTASGSRCAIRVPSRGLSSSVGLWLMPQGPCARESRGEGWELPGHRHLASTIQFSCVLSQKME